MLQMKAFVLAGIQITFKGIGRVILAHINTNFIRFKIGNLIYSVKGKVDALMLTETKFDDFFPTMQLNIEVY